MHAPYAPPVGVGVDDDVLVPTLLSSRARRKAVSREPREIDGVTYKIADSREEREQAFGLVYEAYSEAGLMKPNEARMRVLPHHLLPTTDIFIASHQGQVIYTTTLISNDFLNLPLKNIYAEEIAAREAEGAYLAEVSCLACRRGYLPRSKMYTTLINLLSLMVQYARWNDIDRLVIAVHPRHRCFYERLFGCTQFGPERSYSTVCDRPAVAFEHDFHLRDQTGYRLKERLYAEPFPRWQLLRQPMFEEEKRYFSEIMDSGCNSKLACQAG